jgi:hypothetical protein
MSKAATIDKITETFSKVYGKVAGTDVYNQLSAEEKKALYGNNEKKLPTLQDVQGDDGVYDRYLEARLTNGNFQQLLEGVEEKELQAYLTQLESIKQKVDKRSQSDISTPTPTTPASEPEGNTSPNTDKNFMRLVPTGEKNQVGNPIYNLELYNNGKLFKTVQALTGRANTQDLDRNTPGNAAPLPDGRYNVGDRIYQKNELSHDSELGTQAVDITATFNTSRSLLLIHGKPSWGLNDGEDGTKGCIAVKEEDLPEVMDFIRQHNPSYLDVAIAS